MKKTLAAIVSSALIGCANPQLTQPMQSQEQTLNTRAVHVQDLALTFFEHLLRASDILEQNMPGHVTNLRTLEAKIAETKAITSQLPADERLRRIHNYFFDHNPHRITREAPPGELYTAAQVQRIIAADLQDGARPVGSELGHALEYFVIAGIFGHEVTPYLVTQNRTKHIVFSGAGQLIDPTNPNGIRDLPETIGERLTPANLLGLFLNTKGVHEAREGNIESAYQSLQLAYHLYPCADISLNLGETAALLGNTRLARQWFEQTTRLDSSGHAAYERLGELSFIAGDYSQAEQEYMRALERCATSGQLYAKYGETLVALGRQQLAIPFFRRALELEPNNDSLRHGIEQYLEACRTR